MHRAFVTLGLIFLLPSGLLSAQDVAQPVLPSVTLRIGTNKVTAEVADDDSERSKGLMYRESLAPDHGMIFLLPDRGRAAFWMKNTIIPLSIAYISADGVILEIHDMEPRSEKTIPSQFPSIAYALEMTQGWFSDKGVLAGDRISGLPRLTP